MKRYSISVALAILLCLLISPSFAQTGKHNLQVDDGAGHYSIITGGDGGIFTLPNSGGGVIMTSSGGTSPVWLLGGNNNPTSTLIGTLTANDFSVITNSLTRATFSNTPSASTPMLALENTTANIQGVHIYGNADATTSSTLTGNPGVWDLVVEGDAIVTGILGGHDVQLNDALGHISNITNTGNGMFTLPNSGGGVIITSSGGISPVWLLGGNNNPTSSLIGTLTANDFSVITNNLTRATFSHTPSASTPMLSLQNTTANIQGVHIYGNADATTSSTLAGNPGVWDLVVEGDAIVTGILGGHDIQLNDGSGHISNITNTGNGMFTLPNSGGGTIMTSSGGTSPVWLIGGNNNPSSTLIGTLTTDDFSVITNNLTRATFSNTPSATTPMLALQNTTANIQGVHIYGNADATTSSTLAANPGVWDLVVEGDEVVTGILKAGDGSLWIDGRSTSAPHTITTNQSLSIQTTTNDSIMFGTNSTTQMTIGSNGYVGIGTMNPQSPLHIKGAPPMSSHKDAIPYFYLPDPYNHVLTVENTQSGGKGNGIAIIIKNPASSNPVTDGQNNNESSNYITFYNDAGDRNHIRGRIESFSYQNFNDMVQALYNIYNQYVISGDIYNPFNYFTCNLGFDTHFADNTFNSHFMDNAFNSGFLDNVFTLPTLPTFNSGSFPSLDGGSFPTITFSDFKFTVVTPDAFPNINVDLGNILPSLSGGSLPSLSGGSLPSLSGGSVGSICFSCIQNPLNLGNISSPIDFTKFSSPITNITSPFSLNYSFIDGILNSLAAIPYKQKLVDIVSSGPKMAIVKAAATYAAAFFSGGVTYESGSGDYAEWLERADHDENISIGDVVGVIGGKISKNTTGANEYMVASWKPCVLGNMPEAGKEQYFNKVAFMGQVPIKLYGSVKKGDCIIPSGNNDGFAKAIPVDDITVTDLDKVLGVSWQDNSDRGPKIIKIAVGLKPHEMAKVMREQAEEIDQLKADVALIKSQLNPVHHAKYSKKRSKHAKLISSN